MYSNESILFIISQKRGVVNALKNPPTKFRNTCLYLCVLSKMRKNILEYKTIDPR